MRSCLWLPAALLLCVTQLQGASRIHGYVVDSESREPLIGANLQVADEPGGASTNLDGYFVIVGLAEGSYRLSASYQGYRRRTVPVDLPASRDAYLEVELEPTTLALEEVVVTAEQETRDLQRLEVYAGNILLDRETIRTAAPLIERDVLRSFQTIPGVLPSNDYTNELNVRGSSGDETLILLDGVEVYNPNHMGGIFSSFIPSTVKHALLRRSSYPAQHGGRLGGVMYVATREGDRERLSTDISLGMLSSSLMLGYPVPGLDKASMMLALRRTYVDWATRAFTSEELPYYFTDFQGRANWDIDTWDRVSLTGYWGDDVFKGGSIDFGYGNRAGNLNWRHIWSSSLYTRTILAFTRYRAELDFGGREGYLEQNTLNDWSARVLFEYHRDATLYTEAGLLVKTIDTNYDVWAGNVHIWDVRQTMAEISLYARARWRPWPVLILEPGLRLALYRTEEIFKRDAEGYARLEPRLGLKYFISDRLRAKLAWGLYNQAIQKYRRDGSTFSSVWTVSDSTMSPAHAIHWTGGVELDLDDDTVLELEAYHKNLNAVREGRVMGRHRSGDSIYNDRVYHIGNGEAFGLDLSLLRNRGDWTGRLGYSLSWAVRRFDEINDGRPFYASWDKRHNFNLAAKWNLRFKKTRGFPFSKWLRLFRYNEAALGLGLRLASSPRYTRPWSATYLGDEGLNYDEGRIHNYGAKNAHQLSAYSRVDLAWTFVHRKPQSLFELKIGMLNLFQSPNYWGVHFDNDPEAENEVPQEEQIPGIERMPSIEFTWSF